MNEFTIIRKQRGKSFHYYKNGTLVKEKRILDRIKKLRIPPNWKNVQITDSEVNHLQAIGIDERKRTQYIYHPMWIALTSLDKYKRMGRFCKLIPKFEKKIKQDLTSSNERVCIIAHMFRLLQKTHMRVGGEEYAKDNSTYGLCTLENKHIRIKGPVITFNFIGKKGVKQRIQIRDSTTAPLLQQLIKNTGRVFKENGKVITSGDMNGYLQNVMGREFTCKDFRTYASNLLFLNTICKLPIPQTEKEKKKNLKDVFDYVANKLGHTKAVSRRSYVMPIISDQYKETPSIFYKQNPKQLLLRLISTN